MAAILIGAGALVYTKVQEKRDKKKAAIRSHNDSRYAELQRDQSLYDDTRGGGKGEKAHANGTNGAGGMGGMSEKRSGGGGGTGSASSSLFGDDPAAPSLYSQTTTAAGAAESVYSQDTTAETRPRTLRPAFSDGNNSIGTETEQGMRESSPLPSYDSVVRQDGLKEGKLGGGGRGRFSLRRNKKDNKGQKHDGVIR
ncbi:MAG: hypothetical protein M1827_000917 [Pycnora praestabilis]|nr:MAG: hypothetical protein M1827_000917 [Pycnora praestabilis]